MEEEKKEKSRYRQIIDGEVEPQSHEKGWKNLEKRISFNMRTPEERKEIARKGAEAVNKLHGEKKSARQSLEKLLTIKVDDNLLESADIPKELADKLKRDNPNATLYDLIQMVAIGRAVGGNMKAYELIRDTHGDMPVKQVEISENITTDADREMLKQISERLKEGDRIEIVRDITEDGK